MTMESPCQLLNMVFFYVGLHFVFEGDKNSATCLSNSFEDFQQILVFIIVVVIMSTMNSYPRTTNIISRISMQKTRASGYMQCVILRSI